MVTDKICPACNRKFPAVSAKHKYCSKECRKRGTPETPAYMLTDPSNHLLALPGPSVMCCGIVESEEGPYLLVTVRTASTTQTVSLTAEEATAWVVELGQKVSAMTQGDDGDDDVIEGVVVGKR